MRTRLFKRFITSAGLSFALLLIPLSPIAFAQTIEADEYKGVAVLLGARAPGQLALLKPGTFLNPAFDYSDIQEQQLTAALFNRSVRTSLIYASGDDISEVEYKVLNEAEWAKTPLLSSQRRELEERRRLLFQTDNNPTTGYQLYLRLKRAFEDLRSEFERTPADQRTPEMRDSLDKARDDLRLRGHESTYRPAAARYDALIRASSLEWRQNDIDNLTRSKVLSPNGVPFYETRTQQPLDSLDRAPWAAIHATGSSIRANQRATSLGDDLGDIAGWWRWSTNSDISSASSTTTSLDSDDFTISFDMLKLTVSRPWFDPMSLDSQAWRWRSQNTAVISDGKLAHNVGTAPALATQVILIRNLRIYGPLISQFNAQLKQAVRNRLAVSFGPFLLTGSCMGSNPSFLPAILSANSLVAPFVQVIGFEISVFRKSPNPNLDFEWPQRQ